MTSGADSRSAFHSSFLALLSPAPTLSERVCNAASFSFTSADNSSAVLLTLSPLFSFAFVTTRSE